MGKSQLVEADINEGRRLFDTVRNSEKVIAALWFYDADSRGYHLVLALPEASPLAAYTRIQGVLGGLTPPSSIGLEEIRIVKADDPLITELRWSLVLPNNQGLRLMNTSVGPYYIDDAYIYYLESIPVATNQFDALLAVKNGSWRVVPATFVYRIGLLQDIQTSEFAIPMTRGRRGLNVDVFLLTDIEKGPCQPGTECKTRAKVVQQVYRDGRMTQVIPREDSVEVTLKFDEHGRPVA